MKLRFRCLILFLLTLPAISGLAQQAEPVYLKYLNHPWVDSTMKTLSLEEKIGQLIWIAGFANREVGYDVQISNQVKEYGIGGVIFFQGLAAKQAQMINNFRDVAKVPPIIAIDGEWGLGMRIEGIEGFPYQMTLGAIKNDSLIYQMGMYVAKQMKRAGIDINLAPVADVNVNPKNPVINYRSFGERPDLVSRKSISYMMGMQDNGIMAVAKHFPGHGDTEVDSHLDLPLIKHNRQRLDSVELVPFRALIDNGIGGVMPGHIWVPSLDPTMNTPATISKPILTSLLKNEMGFKGLILSDAMNMGGITKYTKPGEAEVMALKAGMDVLEYVTNPEIVISSIVGAVKSGDLTLDDIESKCRKVLALKYWSGLNKPFPVYDIHIEEDLFTPQMKAHNRELYASAMTVLENKNNILPVKRLEDTKIASLSINMNEITLYQKVLAHYTKVDHFNIDIVGGENYRQLLEKLKDYDVVIAGIYGNGQRSGRSFVTDVGLDSLIRKLNRQNSVVISWFGNPYAIERVPSLQDASAVVLAYQQNDDTESLAAQLIFGAFGGRGTLPVSINDKYKAGYGIKTAGNIRLQYGLPESAQMDSGILNQKIDSIVTLGLTDGAYPGCIVMVARRGIVVFSKTYGYHEYDGRIEVKEDDIYDLASVTKVSAGTPALMLLSAEGKFSPAGHLGDYVPFFRGSNKDTLLMRDILTHQAGLVAWIPFWRETIKDATGDFRNRTLQTSGSDRFPITVANDLYIYKNYRTKLFKEIRDSELKEKKYVYSDLAFIIAPEVVTNAIHADWTEYLTKGIYMKLGAFDLTFNPYLKYSMSRIVPTEYDSLFRRQLIQGYVHDEGAAMLGGISGHAGLFASAGDLMKLMEMYRRMGSYGGEQIIPKEVMEEYTSYQFPENNNRRGLGFDKPTIYNDTLDDDEIYPVRAASPSSFGHSGFTGTFVWVDPEKELTYVFLSNRVYPTRNNSKISELNIRTAILQALYDSIITE